MTAPNNTKLQALSFNANGDNTAVTAVAGAPIVVWKLIFTVAAAQTVAFKDGASTTLGNLAFTAAATCVMDSPEGFPLFRTTIGNAFIINLSSGVAINGMCYYSLA